MLSCRSLHRAHLTLSDFPQEINVSHKGHPHTHSHHGHHHDHVHFKCLRCGQTNCLNIDVPPVRLPKGYRSQEVNVLIQGICERCSE